MPIDLDWQFENEDGWEPVKEDPESLNRRRRKFMLTILILALIIPGTLFGARLRLKFVDAQRERSLKDSVAAEALSMRIGDMTTFLIAQTEDEEWRRSQVQVFQSYERFSDTITENGTIVDLQIDADTARVVVSEKRDGDIFTMTWFYQYEEKGWRHVPSIPEYWAEPVQAKTDYINITYPPEDAIFVEDYLMPGLDEQFAALCDMGLCAPDQRWEVVVTTDGRLRTGWMEDGSFVIRSLQLRGLPQYNALLYDQAA